MKLTKYLITSSISLLFIGLSRADFTVSGTITDSATGETLPGATVLCEGTTQGTTSTNDGTYTFTVSDSCERLLFSYVGFKTQVVSISGRTVINTALQADGALNEVIITATTNKAAKKCWKGTKDGKQQYRKNDQCIKCSDNEKLTQNENKEYSCIAKEPIDPPLPPDHPDIGIKCDMTKILTGSCGMDIEDMLGIRQSTPNTTPTEFVQDIVLTATFFIGTVLTIALIVSGLMIIFGGANENTASRGRQGIKYALIGYVLVLCSYSIIRLVQYIAG